MTHAHARWFAAFVFLAAAAPLAAQEEPRPGPQPEVIYGGDDRLDLWQVKNQKVRRLADSTVALFQAANVSPSGELTTQPYGERMRLCKEERFYEQVMGAFCSGSLVAPNVIMTAGHCIESQEDCESTKFVFGFAIKKKKKNPKSGEIYGCKKLLGRLQENQGADWALVELDRTVSGHTPLKVNRTGDPANGAPLFVIGHPAGLPTKIAGGAKVRDASPKGYFVANLDTYGGNSGSAVFNGTTGVVEGILVRGETDYVWKGDCRVSNVCKDDACRGEDVTKVSALQGQIPPQGLEKSAQSIQASVLKIPTDLLDALNNR